MALLQLWRAPPSPCLWISTRPLRTRRSLCFRTQLLAPTHAPYPQRPPPLGCTTKRAFHPLPPRARSCRSLATLLQLALLSSSLASKSRRWYRTTRTCQRPRPYPLPLLVLRVPPRILPFCVRLCPTVSGCGGTSCRVELLRPQVCFTHLRLAARLHPPRFALFLPVPASPGMRTTCLVTSGGATKAMC